MNPLEGAVLGLVQGLTEFIPVSSSGHLEFIQQLIGNRSNDFHLFLEFINIGTLLALIIFYRYRIKDIILDVFKRHNYRLALNLIITTIPAATIGFLASSLISSLPFFSSIITISFAMIAVGILMIVIDKLPKLSRLKNENHLTKPRALLIGLAQVFALIPGTSRSGSTIIAGRIVGLNSESAANYSFLASIPIMLGVLVKTLISTTDRAYFFDNLPNLVIANLIAFAFGLLALRFVMQYLKRREALRAFGWYRIIIASVALIFLLIQ